MALVLGIESSCDETAVALVEDGHRVIGEAIASQADDFAAWGGVVPEIAARGHVLALPGLVARVLAESGRTLNQLDAVAVGAWPGLIGSLLVGVTAAKVIAARCSIALIAVDHIEAHLGALHLGRPTVAYPLVGLVASGGHSHFYHASAAGRLTVLGGTIDDAAGEAYDKVGKLLGLPYPGGKYIDQLAQTGNPAAIRFPRALPQHDVLDFSFSGLKTSVLHHLRAHDLPQGQALNDLCASFQEAVADALSKKAIAACKKLHLQRLVLCGGVAANSRLRSLCAQRAGENGIAFFVPRPQLCTDNGAMIAAAGFAAHARGTKADLELNASATWQL